MFRRSIETDLCLPEPHALLNLLEPARSTVVERFAKAGIPWHGGVNGQPGNHLLSSQVQCVNALGPLIDDPRGLKEIFGEILPIADVLSFGESSYPEDHVVFEWTGQVDYLSEWGSRKTSRGANATSADAAIRYRTDSGDIEIALIEWKYVEAYDIHPLKGGPGALATRLGRYSKPFVADDSPFLANQISMEALFFEPVYQLLRLQLLAREMEKAGEGDAGKVRLVYAAPSRNESVWRAINSILSSAGTDATSATMAWRKLLKDREKFLHYETARLVRERAPTTPVFKERYGHLDN